MILRYLDFHSYILKNKNHSFLFRIPGLKDTWLFNCSEGSQFNFLNCNLKINNLSKIIIPSLHIVSVSGLLGLLSTLNLIGRTKTLHIYAPIGLKYYLDLGKKYSCTNFSYLLYVHTLKTGLIINQYFCRIYTLDYEQGYQFLFVQSQRSGTFLLKKAKINNLKPGPIYGKLKKGFTFLTPDGFIIEGNYLTSSSQLGIQVLCLTSFFYKKTIYGILNKHNFILFF
uniref:Ribonuclease Z n=1 Tax=Tolypiocladia glomerulata TaxID=860646 RepID=A0A1Z1MU76_9FLOR|nr:ribonuclease Z [Tolypiocladia glomerulata]ARW69660.1 ribonuclease Z [Tolypiocladia glomerulata]